MKFIKKKKIINKLIEDELNEEKYLEFIQQLCNVQHNESLYKQILNILDDVRSRSKHDNQLVDYYIIENQPKFTKNILNEIAQKISLSPIEYRTKTQTQLLEKQLQSIKFFQSIPSLIQECSQELYSSIQMINFPKDKVIYHHNDTAKSIYLLIKGDVFYLKPIDAINYKQLPHHSRKFYPSTKIFNDWESQFHLDSYQMEDLFHQLVFLQINCPLIDKALLTEMLNKRQQISEEIMKYIFYFEHFPQTVVEKITNEIDSYENPTTLDINYQYKNTCISKSNCLIIKINKQKFLKILEKNSETLNKELYSSFILNPLFKRIIFSDFEFLMKFCDVKNMQAGQKIISNSQQNSKIYQILSGEVSVHEDEHLKTYLGLYEIFGEDSIFEKQKTKYNCTCTQSGKVLIINGIKFLQQKPNVIPITLQDTFSQIFRESFMQKFKCFKNGSALYNEKYYQSKQSIYSHYEVNYMDYKQLHQSTIEQKVLDLSINLSQQKNYKNLSLSFLNKNQQQIPLQQLQNQEFINVKTKYYNPPNEILLCQSLQKSLNRHTTIKQKLLLLEKKIGAQKVFQTPIYSIHRIIQPSKKLKSLPKLILDKISKEQTDDNVERSLTKKLSPKSFLSIISNNQKSQFNNNIIIRDISINNEI